VTQTGIEDFLTLGFRWGQPYAHRLVGFPFRPMWLVVFVVGVVALDAEPRSSRSKVLDFVGYKSAENEGERHLSYSELYLICDRKICRRKE